MNVQTHTSNQNQRKGKPQIAKADPSNPHLTPIDRPILTPPNGHKKVLLHSCCAPCSGEVMEAMIASGIEFTIYFYNPNIHPKKEYCGCAYSLRDTNNFRRSQAREPIKIGVKYYGDEE